MRFGRNNRLSVFQRFKGGKLTTIRKQHQLGQPQRSKLPEVRPKCGLCGKTDNLTKSPCCNRWICDDGDQYVMFSFARNSCYRNHDRYTLCSFHHNEGHGGNWQDCPRCRKSFETEMYVWYGTNEHNFEKLENPPAYKPTKCATCKKVIHLGEDGYMMSGRKHYCEKCANRRIAKVLKDD